MLFIIKETNEQETLTLIDPKTNCEYTADFMQVANFERNEDGEYLISQDDYNWWLEVINAQEGLNTLIETLKENGVDEEEIHNTMSMSEETECFASINLQLLLNNYMRAL